MTTIIFEAHGTTFDNEQGRASGHNDVALSPLGEQNARDLGLRYTDTPIDVVFCSDLSRAYRTAEIAFEGRDIPVIKDARLRECDYGTWTGRPSKEIEADRINRITDSFPEGESYAQTSLRMLNFLNEISQQYGEKTIMIIGHRATQYGIQRWINATPLKELVTQHWSWQPGWTYHLWERVVIETPRGITLSGHLYKRDSKKIVITAHGFTSDQFGKSTLLARALARQDISALTFDFSGCGESGDDTISIAKEVEDLTAMVKYAHDLGYESIGIMGTSAGGLVAQRVWSPTIATLVLWCPVTHSWEKEEKFSSEQLEEFEREGTLTQQKPQPYLRTSVLIDKVVLHERSEIDTKGILSRITCPVLIVHGDQDSDVPLTYSQEAMRHLSSDSRLEVIPGADHFFMKEREALIHRSVEWFAKYL